MRLYLAAPPEDLPPVPGRRICLMAFRIGPEDALLSGALPPRVRGGLLSLSDWGAPEVRRPEQLRAAAAEVCGRLGLEGVVLDFAGPFRQDLAALAACFAAAPVGRLYVPEVYHTGGAALVSTALSGGDLRQHLQEAVRRYGAGHVALDVERVRMDFRLPCPTGEGEPLTGAGLSALLRERVPHRFFSRELCARYGTYAQNGQGHLVLFDDGATLREKLRLGEELGIRETFLLWPEVRDLAGALPLR